MTAMDDGGNHGIAWLTGNDVMGKRWTQAAGEAHAMTRATVLEDEPCQLPFSGTAGRVAIIRLGSQKRDEEPSEQRTDCADRGAGNTDAKHELSIACSVVKAFDVTQTRAIGYFACASTQSTSVLISASGTPAFGGIGTGPQVPLLPAFTLLVSFSAASG